MYCVCQVACERCAHVWSETVECSVCNERPCMRWSGPNTLQQFCEWLYDDNHKGVIAIAHNAKAYDAQFILRELTRNGVRVNVIPRGLNIISMEARGVTVKCSMNFLPTKLSNLPKMFNFQHEAVKGLRYELSLCGTSIIMPISNAHLSNLFILLGK